MEIKDPPDINDSSTNIDSRETLLSFIKNYRDLSELWDLTTIEYSNKKKKKEAYEKLLKIYKIIKRNATIGDVKRKINTLRANYRKELGKIEDSKRSGAHGNEIYKPRCWIFKEMTFLKKVQSMRSKYRKHQFRHVDTNDCDEFRNEIPAKSFNKSKLVENNQKKSQNEVLINYCEEETITRNWSFKLAKMNSDQRIWAEKFINDILTEGVLGTLHRHSLFINQNEIINFTSSNDKKMI